SPDTRAYPVRMTEKFLGKTYSPKSAGEAQEHYDRWAATYEQEVADNGYATPQRIAEALWRHLPEAQAPVLDFGCGTGLSGLALRLVGFEVVDGADPSSEMLEIARQKDTYRAVTLLDISDPVPIAKGQYRAVVGAGVFGIGAAPPDAFDGVMHGLSSGGLFAFSYNDHALADASFTGKLNEWLDCGAARLLFREHGPHLPAIGLNAEIYVIERA
ncbi:MAG: methyltransferase domain-containing protein, partial [Pseudomonadota bacterium]